MTCHHLRTLEQALISRGFRETYRGQPWSSACREWVYFDCLIALDATRELFKLVEPVQAHEHRGTHDGAEAGFVCGMQ